MPDDHRMPDDHGMVVGRYRLATQLGSGGMGVVWQAHDERLNRTVAVKQLLMPPGLTDPEAADAKRRAMREGRIAARLQHPHAIMIYDVVAHGDQPFLVMEYLPSKSLAEVLAESGPLPPEVVAGIGAKVAAALAAAHAAGVVHRDVKPGNVLLGEHGQVKITDFGISRAVEDATGTTTGLIAGTPAYLAPEVARGLKATFAADVFSLGSTLYAAVEGVPPFGPGDNPIALLHQVAAGQINPPSRAGALTDILFELMRPEPDHRPTMAQASEALAALVARSAAAHGPQPASPGPVRPDEPDHTVPVAARPRRSDRPADPVGRRRATLVAAVAVLAALVLAGGLFVMQLGRNDPNRDTAAPPASAPLTPGATAQTGTPAGPTTQAGLTTPPPGSTAAATTTFTRGLPAVPPEPPDNPAALQQAITDYYALMPADLAAGWTRLTARYQVSPAGGFSGYQNFWNQMQSVRVSDVTARPGQVVEATVEYTFKTGKVVLERHSYALVTQDGRWVIDRSSVLSSVTTQPDS